MENVRKAEVTEQEPFESCANCGYQKGFHTVLVRVAAAAGEPNVRIVLKCPNCATNYDVGLMGTVR